jgi:hypothetical protein
MKKILFQIANYSDQRQYIFDQLYSVKTKNFADKHGYDYQIYKGPCIFRNCSWQKIYYLNNLIETKQLDINDRVLFLDADTCIKDINEDYPFKSNFNYSIDNGNTHCMGIWGMKICSWTVNLVKNLMNDELYESCKNTDLWKLWSEQGAWYTLAGIPRHSWKNYFEMPNNGWHQTEDEFLKTKIKYSIDELTENVYISGPEWNTTLLDEDKDSIGDGVLQYNIVKSKKSDTKIRHFAAQQWRLDYL